MGNIRNLIFRLLSLVFISMIVISCNQQALPDQDSDSEPIDYAYTLTLGSPLPGDTILAVDGAHGDCTISAGFDEITYTKTDLAYTGTDVCGFVDSICSNGFAINFSAPVPALVGTGANCASI